jgi:hypothetical protein
VRWNVDWNPLCTLMPSVHAACQRAITGLTSARTSGSLRDALGIYTFQEKLRVVQYRKTMSGVVRICYEICAGDAHVVGIRPLVCDDETLVGRIVRDKIWDSPVKWMPSGRAESTHIMG